MISALSFIVETCCVMDICRTTNIYCVMDRAYCEKVAAAVPSGKKVEQKTEQKGNLFYFVRKGGFLGRRKSGILSKKG